MQDKNQRNPCRAACLFLDAHQQHSIAKQLSNVQAKALGISSNKPALPRIVTLQRAVQGPRAGLRVTPPTVKSGTCQSLSLHGPQGWGHCAGHPGSSGHIQMSRCVQLFHLKISQRQLMAFQRQLMAFQKQRFSFLFVAVDLLNPHPCCEVDSGLGQKWG